MKSYTNGRTLALGVLAIVALAAVGCGGDGGGGAAANDLIAKGEKLYQQTCATCHGADGHGMPKLGKDLHDNAFTKGLGDAEMLQFIKEGRPAWHEDNTQGVDMPPRGGNPALTDDDLLAIIAFQRTWSPR
ncbi:MAG: c-type cytochrome [Thermoanaerobaculia bacterium]